MPEKSALMLYLLNLVLKPLLKQTTAYSTAHCALATGPAFPILGGFIDVHTGDMVQKR